MAKYYTASELRAHAGALTASAASDHLAHSAAIAHGPFDIFISYASDDRIAAEGLRRLLRGRGHTVYVDYAIDVDLGRKNVSAATASRLRRRLDESSFLLFATSRAARLSRWMPWELGYFDGVRGPEGVLVWPIEDGVDRRFAGQEYLGVYNHIEQVRVPGNKFVDYVVKPSGSSGMPLSAYLAGETEFDVLTPG